MLYKQFNEINSLDCCVIIYNTDAATEDLCAEFDCHPGWLRCHISDSNTEI